MLPLRLTAKMRKACSPLPQTVSTPRSGRQLRQYVFLNFFACRLCWRREASCRSGFLSFNLDSFGCLQRVIWIHGLVFILLPYGWFSCLGKIHKRHVNVVFKLTTSDLFRPAVVAGEIQLSKTLFHFSLLFVSWILHFFTCSHSFFVFNLFLSNSIVYSSHARHVSIWCDCSCAVR